MKSSQLPLSRWLPASLLLVLTLALGLSTACTRKQDVRTIEPKEAYGMVRNDFAVIVDVREASEINEGMIEGAKWFPYTSKIETNETHASEWEAWAATLPKDKLIILYCRSGRRSGLLAERLASKGFRVANMGAFDDWVKAGLPVTRPEASEQK